MTRARLVFAALVLLALLPAAARAAVSCSYNAGTRTLSITATTSPAFTNVYRGSSAILVLDYQENAIPCTNGPVSVTHVNSVVYNDLSSGGTTLEVSAGTDGFGPGFTDEGAGNISEIEVTANMGTGTDYLWYQARSSADDIRVGSPGAGQVAIETSLEEATADADVTAGAVEGVFVNLVSGADYLSGAGGAGTGDPLSVPLEVWGGPDADHVTGGAGDDTLAGFAGDDVLDGGAGNDTLRPDSGDDEAHGGPGSDTYSGGDAETGLTIDLGQQGAAQATGEGDDVLDGIEQLRGSDHDDVLRGDAGGDNLSGGAGDDVLAGRGADDGLAGGDGTDTLVYAGAAAPVTVELLDGGTGTATGADGSDEIYSSENLVGSAFADVLRGNAGPNRIDAGGGADTVEARGGDDTLLLRDGTADTADCGDGTDSVVADAAGTDALTGCETLDLTPSPGGATPGTDVAPPPGGGTTAPAPVPVACKASPPRATVTLDRRLRSATVRLAGAKLKVRRRHGRLVVRVDLRGRAAGTYRLKITGRTAKGRRLTRTRRFTVCA